MRLCEQYLRACYPVRCKVLGRKLQVFTVAHAELLDRAEYNPASIGPEDLLTAVRICSLPRHKAEAALDRGGWTGRDLVTLLMFRNNRSVFDQAALAFQNYVEAAKETPAFWADDKQTRAATCPPLLMVKRDLMHYYGYSADDVLDLPFGQAEWERLAILEAEGVLDFKTDEDNDALAEALRIAQEDARQAMEVADGPC